MLKAVSNSGGGGGSGTVTGPGSSINNDIVVFNGTSGTVIADSGINITSIGAIIIPYSETPAGTINGVNVTFTLANTPANPAGVQIILDGVVQYNSIDFNISGNTITFITAPALNSSIYSFYNTSTGGTSFVPYTGATSAININTQELIIGSAGSGIEADSAGNIKNIGQYYSLEFDNGSATTTKTINWVNGNVQYVTLTGNTTFTFTNPGSGSRLILQVAGAFTPTFPGTVRWSGGTTPTATATAGHKDVYTFLYSGKDALYSGSVLLNIATT